MTIDANEVRISKVDKSKDLELILSWRSNPDIYINFLKQKGPLKWEEHNNYWDNRQGMIDYIIIYNNRRVGLISIDNPNNEWPQISIMIGETSLWGLGLSKISLGLFLRELSIVGVSKLEALINKSNVASVNLFKSVGFKQTNKMHHEDWVILRLELGGG